MKTLMLGVPEILTPWEAAQELSEPSNPDCFALSPSEWGVVCD